MCNNKLWIVYKKNSSSQSDIINWQLNKLNYAFIKLMIIINPIVHFNWIQIQWKIINCVIGIKRLVENVI